MNIQKNAFSFQEIKLIFKEKGQAVGDTIFDIFKCFKKQIEMKLIDEKLTKVILDSLGEGLFTVDQDFRVISINRAAEEILGLHKSDVIGDFCKNIFKTKRCFADCPLEGVLEKGENLYDIEIQI